MYITIMYGTTFLESYRIMWSVWFELHVSDVGVI